MGNEFTPTGGEGATPDDSSSLRDRTIPEIDLDALFEVLADAQRRQILAYLDATDDDVAAYSDLIEHVADDSAEASTDDRDRIAVGLHHNHLPKLADAGVPRRNHSRTADSRRSDANPPRASLVPRK
ncbi:hypothetical protein BRD15_12555 [Halobacteriales archaeon SW_6_65_15]|nr:MAG: hypothetical protein BRD15_12555 [Halobacteriales archaeon SW_6_65_15]